MNLDHSTLNYEASEALTMNFAFLLSHIAKCLSGKSSYLPYILRSLLLISMPSEHNAILIPNVIPIQYKYLIKDLPKYYKWLEIASMKVHYGLAYGVVHVITTLHVIGAT